MRIVSISAFKYDVQYRHGEYHLSGGRTYTKLPSMMVRIRTDNGLEGWGETAPLGGTYLPSFFEGELAALRQLCGCILGLDPRSPALINEAMDRTLLSNYAAKAVLDFACWDLYGKDVGLASYHLFGGPVNSKLNAFAVIGVGDEATMVRTARTEVDNGYQSMQVKIGKNPVEDARRVRAVRANVPEHVEVWADANAAWNLGQAMTYIKALGDSTVPLEQPCRHMKDNIELARRTLVPIILDESIITMSDLLEAHAGGVTAINLKLSRVGGMSKARTLRDTAVALGMMMTIDDPWGCALTTAQIIQFAASTPRANLRAVDLFAEWTSPIIAEIPRLGLEGMVDCTNTAGNGYSAIDLEALGDPLFTLELNSAGSA